MTYSCPCCLAFPDNKNGPPVFCQLTPNIGVSFLVPLQFLSPERSPGFWHPIAHGAAVSVPKASVNKDDLPPILEDEIWTAWNIAGMKSIPVPQRIHESADAHLRFGILAPDLPHHLPALCLGPYVCHEFEAA